MFLPFSANRRLSRIAADAARIEAGAASATHPWRRSIDDSARPRPCAGPAAVEADDAEGTRCHLAAAIAVAVVGGADDLAALLTEDAVTVSPTQVCSSREVAVAARDDRTAALVVVDFEVTRLVWTTCVVVAEWRVVATQAAPLLVGDDVLVEGSDRPITLTGATVAERCADRFSAVRTYFDEAALIEQVVLGS